MSITMYEIAVPSSTKHLEALDAILDKAAAYAEAKQDRSGGAAHRAPLSRTCTR